MGLPCISGWIRLNKAEEKLVFHSGAIYTTTLQVQLQNLCFGNKSNNYCYYGNFGGTIWKLGLKTKPCPVNSLEWSIVSSPSGVWPRGCGQRRRRRRCRRRHTAHSVTGSGCLGARWWPPSGPQTSGPPPSSCVSGPPGAPDTSGEQSKPVTTFTAKTLTYNP